MDDRIKIFKAEIPSLKARWLSGLSALLGILILGVGITMAVGLFPRRLESTTSTVFQATTPHPSPIHKVELFSKPESERISLTGIWESLSTNTSKVAADGHESSWNEKSTIRIELFEDGKNLSGKFVRATNTDCPKATIKGERHGDDIVIIVYGQPSERSSCCAGSAVRLKGKILPTSQITGSFEQISPIKPGCYGGIGTAEWTKVE